MLFKLGCTLEYQEILKTLISGPPQEGSDLITEGCSLSTRIFNYSQVILVCNSNWEACVKSVGEGNGNPRQYSCLRNPMDRGAWWAAVHGVTKSRTRLRDFTFTFHFHALEKEMATHSSVLAWRIPGVVEPGGLPSMGCHRVRYDWSDLVAAAVLGCYFLKSGRVSERCVSFNLIKCTVNSWASVSIDIHYELLFLFLVGTPNYSFIAGGLNVFELIKNQCWQQEISGQIRLSYC